MGFRHGSQDESRQRTRRTPTPRSGTCNTDVTFFLHQKVVRGTDLFGQKKADAVSPVPCPIRLPSLGGSVLSPSEHQKFIGNCSSGIPAPLVDVVLALGRLQATWSPGSRLLGSIPFSTQSSRAAPWWQAPRPPGLGERGMDLQALRGACFQEKPAKGLERSLARASTIQACAAPQKSSV